MDLDALKLFFLPIITPIPAARAAPARFEAGEPPGEAC